jgi:hypothetical protein
MQQGNTAVGLSALDFLYDPIPKASAVAGGYGGTRRNLPRRNEMKPVLSAPFAPFRLIKKLLTDVALTWLIDGTKR